MVETNPPKLCLFPSQLIFIERDESEISPYFKEAYGL